MIRALDTLVGRLLLVSLFGVILVHVLSLWIYEHALHNELTRAHEVQLSDRILSIKRSVMGVPEGRREALAHDLSSGAIEAHWNTTKGAVAGGPGSEAWQSLVMQIKATAKDLRPDDVVIGTSTDPHVALLSLRLPDSSWLDVSLFAASRAKASEHGTILSTSLMAFGVVVMSILVAAWLTRPLRQMAQAVTAMTPEDTESRVPERGPKEVRALAAAFNGMRGRLADLIERRTRSLAAVSHDLRTPLTRMRLRLGEVDQPDLQRAISADVDEMDQMIEATLSYLKGSDTSEPLRSVDLVALLQTLVDDARDLGGEATLTATGPVVVPARHIALKRALSNLLGNALRYGSKVAISIRSAPAAVEVLFDDNGPGIPEDKLAVVLEPFVRLEDSRNAETGGVGLGLTIAKANIEANGGALSLRNRSGGGLSAIVRLPRPST